MRFKERNDLANRIKEWMKDQIKNNITIPLDTVHLVLAYLDVNGYLNEVVRCGSCKWLQPNGKCKVFADYQIRPSASDYCSYGERREDDTRNE